MPSHNNSGQILSFCGLNVSLRSMAWSQTFLISILSDSTFPNTFLYFKNFLGTNSSIFLWFFLISFSLLQSFLLSIVHLTIFSFSGVATLFLLFFFSFSFDFTPLHKSGHLVILTSPVFQFILGLCAASYGIPKIISVFPKSHTSILILSIWFL